MKNQTDLQASIDSLNTKVSGLGDELTDFAGDFSAAIDALKALIANGGDLTPQVEALSALSDKLDTFATSLTDLDTKAETVSGKKTP